MNIIDSNEIWQVNAGGQIYEASFTELQNWILEGSLLPQDSVRKGKLRWIEAHKVPALTKFFNTVAHGEAQFSPANRNNTSNSFENNFEQTDNFTNRQEKAANSYQTNVFPADATQFATQFSNENPARFGNQTTRLESENLHSQNTQSAPHEFNLMPSADFCSMHPETAAKYVCGTCGNGFCPVCPKSYGGTVKICPFCGAMCKSVQEVQIKLQTAAQYEYDVSKGFGFDDFFAALAYPFRFKSSLLFGAIMFMLFSVGQGAAWMGSIFLVAAGLFCYMLSNMLTFGIMANTIDNFAQGKVGVNFMPSFDDFSIWDDVLHPFFLSIGVYLVSFGLFIVIVFAGIYWSMSQASSMMNDSFSDSQTKQIKNNPALKKQNELYGDQEMPDENGINRTQNNPSYNEEEEFRKINDLVNEQRKKQLEAGLGQTPETKREQREKFVQGMLKTGGVIVVFALLALIWGFFYFPAACCVAGYTRSFVATLNPSIGLETIKLLGWDYLKIWIMSFLLAIAANIVILLLGMIFAPFDMPTVGNIPAQIVGSFFSFYFSVVFSVVLAFALYKNADKLNLFKN